MKKIMITINRFILANLGLSVPKPKPKRKRYQYILIGYRYRYRFWTRIRPLIA